MAPQNFSFCVFRIRKELRCYFRAAHRNLENDGILVLDILGGPESLREGYQETKTFRRFKYVWEQQRFDPITHECQFAIHFWFPDGSRLGRAFVYDWRMWTIPEIRERLTEAGFARSDVYRENADRETGTGNAVYRRRERAPSDPSWVAHIVGIKRCRWMSPGGRSIAA